MLLAFEMSLFARDLAKAGIRHEHPEWPEARVARELLRLAFFPEPLPDWIPWGHPILSMLNAWLEFSESA